MSSSLLIDEPPLQVQPTLASTIGLNEAIFLQQVHYWLNPRFNKNLIDGKHWVHNTYDQWRQQFPFWGEKTIRRTIANLEELKVLVSYVSTIGFKKTKFYTIDYVILNSLRSAQSSQKRRLVTCGQSDQIDLPVWADACGQNDQTDLPVWADGGEQGVQDHLPIWADACGQSDQTDLPVWADACGQSDQIDLVNMTRSYKDTENTTENTLPPPKGSSTRKDEEEDVNWLIKVWNELVQQKLGLPPVSATPKRIAKLETVFTSSFADDIKQWREYCSKIASCKFLLGKNTSGFRVSFDWAINPENIVKILEGAIYDQPEEDVLVDLAFDDFVAEMQAQHASEEYPEAWTNICLRLVKQFNQNTFTSWFARLRPIKLTGESAELMAESRFIKDYIEHHYLQTLRSAVSAECTSVKDIKISCPEDNYQ